jgi:hypothetical protein
LAMNSRRAFCIAVFLGMILDPIQRAVAGESALLRVWSGPGSSVRDRVEAVNRTFTNGTPIRTIVAVLGTNYGILRPYSSVWVGPGPEPRKTCSLLYQFGEYTVVIGTSADITGDPLTGAFTGAGYWQPVAHPSETTNRIKIGQQDGAANRSQPVSSGTNRTSPTAGSGG